MTLSSLTLQASLKLPVPLDLVITARLRRVCERLTPHTLPDIDAFEVVHTDRALSSHLCAFFTRPLSSYIIINSLLLLRLFDSD